MLFKKLISMKRLNINGGLMNKLDINKRIVDRTDCFYWQTDRKISEEETAEIWRDRHSNIENEDLLNIVNNSLVTNKLKLIYPLDLNAQTSFGNINSIRVGVLDNGQEVVIRCHPRGVKNGYFHVESLAADIAIKNGIPSYKTYLIHDLDSDNDISLQVIEKMKGDTISLLVKDKPELEDKIVYNMGVVLAKINQIEVDGFGPFDNNEAKKGKLIGLHRNLRDSVLAGLGENLERLVKYKLISQSRANRIKQLFTNNPLLNETKSVLIHNDLAYWNALSDGENITAVLDWDECVGGTAVQELACWSLFFSPDKVSKVLEGYFSIHPKIGNFDDKFKLLQLRYTISKMALRLKRSSYDKSDFLISLINNGKKHLMNLLNIYGI